jgi:hypothetical protein
VVRLTHAEIDSHERRQEQAETLAPAPAPRLDTARVLALQATAGNRAVGNLLARDDKHEDTKAKDLAKSLAKRLERDRAGVLTDLAKLSDVDRQGLLDVAPKVLPAAQAALLRRCIAFVADPPAADANEKQVPKVTHEGKLEDSADIGKDKLDVRTGVDYDYAGGGGKGGFSVDYKGSHAPETHLLQFIWREVVACHVPKGKTPAKLPKGVAATPLDDCERTPLKRSAGKGYDLTIDPANPNWHVDVGSGGPFRQTNTAANRSAEELAVYDAPDPRDDLAFPLFDADPKPDKVVSHAHFTLFVVQGMDIVHATELDLYWVYTEKKVPPVLPIVTKTASRKLSDGQRAQLAGQYPAHKLDYLP